MEGYFGSKSDSVSSITFKNNQFRDYTSRNASEFIFEFENEESTLDFNLIANQWYNLEIDSFIISSEQVIIHLKQCQLKMMKFTLQQQIQVLLHLITLHLMNLKILC